MSSLGFVSAAATAALNPASPAPTIAKSWVSFSNGIHLFVRIN